MMTWGRLQHFSHGTSLAPLVLGPAGGEPFNGGNPGHAGGRVQVVAAGLTYSLSPTLVIDGNAGIPDSTSAPMATPQDGDYGLDIAELKIPGTNGNWSELRRHPRLPDCAAIAIIRKQPIPAAPSNSATTSTPARSTQIQGRGRITWRFRVRIRQGRAPINSSRRAEPCRHRPAVLFRL